MIVHAAGRLPGPVAVPARPYEYALDPATTALLIIDMQRDSSSRTGSASC
ncbi:MAG: hypothetical protein WBP81_34460 [Solirubrobacteraceae bacterium]